MHAVRATHAETDIDTDISVMHLQSDRQAHSQPDCCMHSDTLRYMQIHAESAYTGSYTQKSTSTDMHRQRYRDRQRHTYTDRDRQIQTETNIDRQIHSDPYRDRHIHTVIHLQRDRHPNRYIHAE